MRRSASALLAALLFVIGALAAVPSAGAAPRQTEDPGLPAGSTGTAPTPGLRIASVSPWVEPDGEFQVRFAPSSSVPADARLSVTVFQSLSPTSAGSLRDEVLAIIDGASPGRILQVPVTSELSSLGDPSAGAVLSLPIRSSRSDAERILIPNPGIHPVELVLTDPQGAELWRQVVFLNRLPVNTTGADRDSRRVRVKLVLPLDAPPTVGPDGRARFDLEDRTTLSAGGALLESVPDAPLLVALRPNVLDGLARSDQAWASTLSTSLARPGADRHVSLRPYVEMDTASVLASGGGAVFGRQMLVGAATVDAGTGQEPLSDTWVLDDQLDDASLATLAGAGITTVLLPLNSFDPDGTTEERLMTRPFRLAGSDSMTGLAFDEEISRLLADRGDDPESRAHQAVSLLMASWFTNTGPDAAAAAILLTPTTDPAVLSVLSAALGSDGPLVADPTGALESAEEPVVELVSRPPLDLSPVLGGYDLTGARLDSYRSMTAGADPDLGVWQVLHDQTMSAELDERERQQLDAAVNGGIDARLAAIELPRSRRVVLTSDDTTIPLRFRNDLDVEVTVRMQARSARLDLGADAETEIVLLPGENRIDVPVQVRAPGETLLRLSFTSPDGQLAVGFVEVPVRSTAISGVGAALSIVSIVFLVLWWIHTHRRKRRNAAKATGAHPAGDGDGRSPAAGAGDVPSRVGGAPAERSAADSVDLGG